MKRWQAFWAWVVAEAKASDYGEAFYQGRRLATALGWIGRVGTALAVASVIFTIAAYLARAWLPETFIAYEESYTGPLLGVYVAAALYGCAWAALLCGAAWSGILVYAPVALYFSYYGGLVGFGRTDTWWLLLPDLLIVALLPLALAHTKGRVGARALAWLLCVGCAFLIFQGTPLRALPLLTRRVAMVLAGTALWGGVLALARRDGPLARLPLSMLVGTVVVANVCFTLGVLGEADGLAATGQNLALAFSDLLFVVALFWFAWGLSLLSNSIGLTERVVRAAREVLPGRVLTGLVMALLAVETLLGRVALVDMDLRLGPLATRLSFATATTLDLHSWIAALALGVILGGVALRREGGPLIRALLGPVLLSWLAIYGYMSSFAGFGEAGGELTWMALAFYVVGFLSDALQGTTILGDDWEPGRSRQPQAILYLGLVLLVAALACFGILGGWPQFARVASLYPFLGITYLGAPYLLYLALRSQAQRTGLDPGETLGAFAWGLVAAVPLLAIVRGPLSESAPAVIAVVHQVALGGVFMLVVPHAILPTASTEGHEEDAPPRRRLLGGVIAGGALSLGYATFFAAPTLPPLGWFYLIVPTWVPPLYYTDATLSTFWLAEHYLLYATGGALMGLTLAVSLVWPRRAQAWPRAWLGLGRGAAVIGVGVAWRWGYEALYTPLRGWPLDTLGAASALLLPLGSLALALFLATQRRLHRARPRLAHLAPACAAGLILLAGAGMLWSATRVARPYDDPSQLFALRLPQQWRVYHQTPGRVGAMDEQGRQAILLTTYYLGQAHDAQELATAIASLREQRAAYQELAQEEQYLALSTGQRVPGWAVSYQFQIEDTLYTGRTLYLAQEGVGYTLEEWVRGSLIPTEDEETFRRLASTLRLARLSPARTPYRNEATRLRLSLTAGWQELPGSGVQGLGKRFESGVAAITLVRHSVPATLTLAQHEALAEQDYRQNVADYRPGARGTATWCGGEGSWIEFTYIINGQSMRGRAYLLLLPGAEPHQEAIGVSLLAPPPLFAATLAEAEEMVMQMQCEP